MLLRTFLALLLISFGVSAQVPEKANKRPVQEPQKAEPYDKADVGEMTKCVTLTTEKGPIEVEMFPDTAPITVRNFLNLVAIGALNKTTFSRVVPDFVIQGGNLFSNPDISYEMKFRSQKSIPDEPNLVRHERGIISMAKSDKPNSANTDFFILIRGAASLDNNFAAFGRVVKGMDVVDEINGMAVDGETPKNPVVITSTAIGACVFEPVAAPKVNELPRLGLRGNVKTVRTTSVDSKGKAIVNSSTGWGYEYSGSEFEFDDSGHLKEIRYFDQNGMLLRTTASTSMISGPGKSPEKREFLKDASEKLLRELVFKSGSSGSVTFKAFDSEKNVVGTGEIKSNENGQVISEVWENSAAGKFTIKTEYDPYGSEATITLDNEKKNSVIRFEYTEFDDKANWTERKVFDSADAKTPVRIEKRVFVYFE